MERLGYTCPVDVFSLGFHTASLMSTNLVINRVLYSRSVYTFSPIRSIDHRRKNRPVLQQLSHNNRYLLVSSSCCNIGRRRTISTPFGCPDSDANTLRTELILVHMEYVEKKRKFD